MIEPEPSIPLSNGATLQDVKMTKKPLTPAELQVVWENDEFHGKSGRYDYDEFTGKRTKK